MQFKTMTFGEEEIRKQASTIEESKLPGSTFDYVIAPPQPIIGNERNIEVNVMQSITIECDEFISLDIEEGEGTSVIGLEWGIRCR